MSQIACLRCRAMFDESAEQCPACGERVTSFQRTYSTRLIDGKYQILDRLGVGGMGEIFKVRHIHLNELRVIKIMRPNVAADDQGMQRFLQEARTSTTIKDRNLAMLYDFAQLEDGSYYMVWEFIDGTNIQKWMSQHGAVPPRLAVEIAIQALHGLEHLHSMGLIHRDISPENIMLSQDRGKLLVKVIDFGIAKSLAEGESGQGLTQTGMFLGKLKYASPEQAGFLKEDEHLDARSDLYSFGIVMYEMLAGRAPFQATNPHGYILKHVTEKPLAIRELNPEVQPPAQLEAIIMKSLEKNRENRFEHAADYATALEAIRSAIPPEQKYGLGEKLVTLSGAKTLADLPKITGAHTQQRTAVGGPPGTRASSDEATVLERGLTQGTVQTISGSAPTVMERKGTLGSDEATVMERGITASPTVVEAKAKWGTSDVAEATVIERQIAPPPSMQKTKTPLYAGIAAVLVIALGAAGWFMFNKGSQQTAPAATTAAPSGTDVVSTPGTLPNIPAGQGVLLLSASPWGELEKIVNSRDNSSITLNEDIRSTPSRITLQPGQYRVVLTGPAGTKTIDVEISAGRSTIRNVSMKDVNYDDLEKEIEPQ